MPSFIQSHDARLRSRGGTPGSSNPAGASAARRNGRDVPVSLTIFKESAIETEAASSQDRSDHMTEPDVLSRDIDALKDQQRDACRELASPSLTVFDRREIRNRIRQSETELRTYLIMMSE